MAECIDLYPRAILTDFHIQDKFYNVSLIDSPEDLEHYRGKEGTLGVYESQHKHPGEKFIVFRTPDKSEMQTACGPITEKDGYISITTAYSGGNTYTFRILQHAFWHICEVCGKRELLTPEEAFEQGWDYPPRLGRFGVVSPRTCGSCSITGTLYWTLITGEFSPQDLDQRQKETLLRIQGEPETLFPPFS